MLNCRLLTFYARGLWVLCHSPIQLFAWVKYTATMHARERSEELVKWSWKLLVISAHLRRRAFPGDIKRRFCGCFREIIAVMFAILLRQVSTSTASSIHLLITRKISIESSQQSTLSAFSRVSRSAFNVQRLIPVTSTSPPDLTRFCEMNI